MAARLSAERLPRYRLEFKQKVVKLTEIPGLEVQVVAEALDLHPVMLSRWETGSFFHSMKADVIHRVRFTHDEDLRACIRSSIPFYNYQRSHSSLGLVSPIEYEKRVA